jgi:hypothetical protein
MGLMKEAWIERKTGSGVITPLPFFFNSEKLKTVEKSRNLTMCGSSFIIYVLTKQEVKKCIDQKWRQ